MVLPPITIAAYNTPRMAYTRRTFQIAYYGKTRWVATPSQMLHPLLVKALDASHYFHAVVTPAFVGQYDYILTTQILRFEQDFVCCPPEGVVIIRAQLTEAATNYVIATRDFIASVPFERRPPYGGVIAINCATSRVIEWARDFTIHFAK